MSESKIVLSSKAMPSGRAGRVPVAITKRAEVTRRASPSSPAISIVCGSTNVAEPAMEVDVVAGELVRDDVGLALDHDAALAQ